MLLRIFAMKRFTGYLVTKFWTKINLSVSVDSPHNKKRHFLIASMYRTITTPHHHPTRWLEARGQARSARCNTNTCTGGKDINNVFFCFHQTSLVDQLKIAAISSSCGRSNFSRSNVCIKLKWYNII